MLEVVINFFYTLNVCNDWLYCWLSANEWLDLLGKEQFLDFEWELK